MKEYTFKELRIKNKLTQEQLAQKSGFSKDYISMIERGERNPSDKAKAIFACRRRRLIRRGGREFPILRRHGLQIMQRRVAPTASVTGKRTQA